MKKVPAVSKIFPFQNDLNKMTEAIMHKTVMLIIIMIF